VIRKTIHLIDRYFEEALCIALITIMGIMIFVQVVMRYVFSYPLSWTDEIAVYCMVWSVYIGGALAVRERAHIRVLNGITAFPKSISTGLVILSDALWLGFNVFLVLNSVLLVQSFFKFPYVSAALGIDQKWAYMILPLAFTLMSLRLIQIYYRWIAHGEPLLPSGDEDELGYE
jgi:TRAP-type C4-dicarboxylate transport system permease small subunit